MVDCGLVRTEWRPPGLAVCYLVILPSTVPAHPDGPGKPAVKRLWCGDGGATHGEM